MITRELGKDSEEDLGKGFWKAMAGGGGSKNRRRIVLKVEKALCVPFYVGQN